MLDSDTGELEEKTLEHEGDTVREFYSTLPGPILVGIEATGSIRKAETRKQKHDRRDARLLLKLLAEDRFPTIWMPSTQQRDLRTLLRHRHQWVRLRSRVQHTLQSMALNRGLRLGHSLWSRVGQQALRALPLAPHASERRAALLVLYPHLQGSIDGLDKEVCEEVGRHGEHDGFRFLQQIPKLDVFRRLVVVPFNFVHGFSLAPEATVRICELTPQCSSEFSYFSSLATTSLDLF